MIRRKDLTKRCDYGCKLHGTDDVYWCRTCDVWHARRVVGRAPMRQLALAGVRVGRRTAIRDAEWAAAVDGAPACMPPGDRGTRVVERGKWRPIGEWQRIGAVFAREVAPA